MKPQNEFLERKHPRLKNFDYSSSDAYFLTLCTKNRAPILGKITVGRLALKPPYGNCTIVRSLKRMINREISSSIWQESFFDHIIRNDEDFYQTRKYIEENPVRWYYKNI